MKDIELPPQAGHVHSDGEFCWDQEPGPSWWPIDLYTADQLRAAIEADRAQRVPDIAEIRRVLACVKSSVDSGIPVTDGWRILDALLSSTPAPAQQECWCETCDLAQGNPLGRTRMSLCPECGDKRCPRAKHHDNACAQHQEPTQQECKPTLPPGHCASDWGGRPTGPCLYTDDEVMEILAAHGIKE